MGIVLATIIAVIPVAARTNASIVGVALSIGLQVPGKGHTGRETARLRAALPGMEAAGADGTDIPTGGWAAVTGLGISACGTVLQGFISSIPTSALYFSLPHRGRAIFAIIESVANDLPRAPILKCRQGS